MSVCQGTIVPCCCCLPILHMYNFVPCNSCGSPHFHIPPPHRSSWSSNRVFHDGLGARQDRWSCPQTAGRAQLKFWRMRLLELVPRPILLSCAVLGALRLRVWGWTEREVLSNGHYVLYWKVTFVVVQFHGWLGNSNKCLLRYLTRLKCILHTVTCYSVTCVYDVTSDIFDVFLCSVC